MRGAARRGRHRIRDRRHRTRHRRRTRRARIRQGRLLGGSGGGVDATAYATRFGPHVRSLILDSAEGPKGLLPLVTEQHQAHATLDEVRLECSRSPTCAPDHPNANGDFEALVAAVRGQPVSGTAFDLNGNPTNVNFDESLLVTIAINGTGAIGGTHGPTGELLAAGASLEQGDPVPLLRLGAEAGNGNLLTDAGPPVDFSWGGFYATVCSDLGVPYSWAVPRAQRLIQLDDAVSALPCSAFAPFSERRSSPKSEAATRDCASPGRSPRRPCPSSLRERSIRTCLRWSWRPTSIRSRRLRWHRRKRPSSRSDVRHHLGSEPLPGSERPVRGANCDDVRRDAEGGGYELLEDAEHGVAGGRAVSARRGGCARRAGGLQREERGRREREANRVGRRGHGGGRIEAGRHVGGDAAASG